MRRSQGPGEMGFLGEAEQQTSEQFIYNRNEKRDPSVLIGSNHLFFAQRHCGESAMKRKQSNQSALSTSLLLWQRSGLGLWCAGSVREAGLH